MTDVTILIPTYRHARLLPFAIRSALAQQGVEIELFVVGDGVKDDTRRALEPFLDNPSVRFFDFPKGERNGERNRHAALGEARGAIVCYLSDDDLLLPEHAVEMTRLLAAADFAHSAPVVVLPGGALQFGPIDIARPEFQALLLRGGWNRISLTGAAHTLDAYRRLPYGWRPAPAGTWSDLYMWQQFLGLDGFRGRTGTRVTHLHLADSDRVGVAVEKRIAELERWEDRMRREGFADEISRELAEIAFEGAVLREARIHELKGVIAHIKATRWWRLRTAIATAPAVRNVTSKRDGPVVKPLRSSGRS